MVTNILYYSIGSILILINLLNYIPHKHWVFRVWSFARLQLWVLQCITVLLFFLKDDSFSFYSIVVVGIVAVFWIVNSIILLPFTFFYKTEGTDINPLDKKTINLISINVYQENKKYDKLINMVSELKPDIVLTMETNKDWEKGISSIEKSYSEAIKIPLENTYGMHFYTNLVIKNKRVNYLVEEDMPSLEIELEDHEGDNFMFYAVHPPPPSPTEADTTKERDAELMLVAKKVIQKKIPVLVAGDFNNVSWSKSSQLFKKKSKLFDSRIGRGFIPSFHAKYWFLRAPIDLLFHSQHITIQTIKTLKSIDSDHFPLFCSFHINDTTKNTDSSETTTTEEREIQTIISEGKTN